MKTINTRFKELCLSYKKVYKKIVKESNIVLKTAASLILYKLLKDNEIIFFCDECNFKYDDYWNKN